MTFKGHSRSSEMLRFDRSHFLLPFHSNQGPILYRFPYPYVLYWSTTAKFSRIYLVMEKLVEWLCWRQYDDMLSRFNIIPECDRRMDGQNSYISISSITFCCTVLTLLSSILSAILYNEHLYSPRMVGEIKEKKNNWNIKKTNSDMA